MCLLSFTGGVVICGIDPSLVSPEWPLYYRVDVNSGMEHDRKTSTVELVVVAICCCLFLVLQCSCKKLRCTSIGENRVYHLHK